MPRPALPALLSLCTLLLACPAPPAGPGAPDAGAPPDAGLPPDAGSAPPEASVAVPVEVPEALRTPPFDTPRTLTVPPGFRVSVLARVPGARFMALTPEGDVLVSVPSTGTVVRVQRREGTQPPGVGPWAEGLRKPHDIVFHQREGQTWVFIAETHRVTRSRWTPGEATRAAAEVVVEGLPDASSPELRGAYGHELKNIALDASHRLYVSIASTCNACLADTQSDPLRGAIYRWTWEGGGRELFARGLRNAEGLAFVPGTDTLWVTVNQRDNILYPHQDGTGWYGQRIPSYVDDHPPEALTSVVPGGHYGWPFCNPSPDSPSGLEQMPYDRDVEFNAEGTRADCSQLNRVDQGLQAHSAPLGLAFLQGTAFPEPYRPGVVLAYHGSWNRTRRTGYKVVHFPWDTGSGQPTVQLDLVTGWVNPEDQSVWGRPVDVAVTPEGALLISDDVAGAVYVLERG